MKTLQQSYLEFRENIINFLEETGIEKLVIKLNNLLREAQSRRLQRRIKNAAKYLIEKEIGREKKERL